MFLAHRVVNYINYGKLGTGIY